METRRALVAVHAKDYQGAAKKQRGEILTMVVQATGYNRVYAARLLRGHGRRVWVRPGVAVQGDAKVRLRRHRPKRYGAELLAPLKRLWELLDYPCGKRLAAGLKGLVEALERHGEFPWKASVREQLLQMSASTMDRLLAGEKRRRAARMKSWTKPGSLLKSQIPIRTFADWDERTPGFLELDLVAHDGGCAQGDFVYTLDATDVCTGWAQQRAVLNKAQQWVFEAFLDLQERFPFALRGIDSDNGSEFINHHLLRYCREHQLTFTRSRPYRKNDTCYVEQKNYSVVRRAVGYGRFVGPQAVQILNALYDSLSLRHNFFLPSLKLLDKQRQGSRVSKRYGPAQTPYERLLQCPNVDAATKARLRRQFHRLNPVALERTIRSLQKRLEQLHRPLQTDPKLRLPAPAASTTRSRSQERTPTRDQTPNRARFSDTFYVRQ